MSDRAFGNSADDSLRLIATQVHGRYLVDRPAGADPRIALFGFHGYGETAQDLLDALRRVRGDHPWLLVSIQALHPFYTRAGEVVASWMTRLDREQAILDNVRYADATIAAVRAEMPGVERTAYVGFSQGTAMAYRAAVLSHQPCDAVVALAGDVPPELASAGENGIPATLIGCGSQDEWYGEAKLKSDLDRLNSMGVQADVARFDGGHEWAEEFVLVARRFLEQTIRS